MKPSQTMSYKRDNQGLSVEATPFQMIKSGTSSSSIGGSSVSLDSTNNGGFLSLSSSSLNSMRIPGQMREFPSSEDRDGQAKYAMSSRICNFEHLTRGGQGDGRSKFPVSGDIPGSGRFLSRFRGDPPAPAASPSIPVRLHVSNLPFKYR